VVDGQTGLAVIRPGRRDEDWPPENLVIKFDQVVKSRWLRINLSTVCLL